MYKSVDEKLMAECLRLAVKGIGYVSPNPMVGALVVKNKRVVSRGYHHIFGGPHAEVNCLQSYKGSLTGATLYVNLEPCAHHGKTPPCTNLIVRSGIRRVVVGMKDPNPLVAGRGIRELRKAGVEVLLGVLGAESRELNRAFITYITHRRPFVHIKIAQTIDARIAQNRGQQKWITGKESRTLVHQWRSEHDAVLVGVGTVVADDPLLTVRMVKGRNPTVVIVDGRLSLNTRAKVLRTLEKRKVIIVTSAKAMSPQVKKVRELTSLGVIIHPIESRTNHLTLKSILRSLYHHGIASVLVEGGGEVFSQFLRSGPMDTLSIFVAPVVFGSGIPVPLPFHRGQVSSVQLSMAKISSMTVGIDSLLQFRFKQKE